MRAFPTMLLVMLLGVVNGQASMAVFGPVSGAAGITADGGSTTVIAYSELCVSPGHAGDGSDASTRRGRSAPATVLDDPGGDPDPSTHGHDHCVWCHPAATFVVVLPPPLATRPDLLANGTWTIGQDPVSNRAPTHPGARSRAPPVRPARPFATLL